MCWFETIIAELKKEITVMVKDQISAQQQEISK